MIYFELFYTFFIIGLFTFGGGYAMIPLIQDNVVGKGWISQGDLTNFIAISEATPGPFAINIATFVGSTTAPISVLGSACATLGIVLPSFIIIILVAFILKKIINNRFVQGALDGIRPITLALILSTALLFFVKAIFFGGNSINPSDFDFNLKSLTILIVLLTFMFIYKKANKKSLNPILLLLLSAGLGIMVF